MEIAHAEMVEKELDAFIERRARREPTPDELEPPYAESVRRYNAARLKERRAEWYAYHADQAERLRRTMEPLVAFHEARAAALCQESGRG